MSGESQSAEVRLRPPEGLDTRYGLRRRVLLVLLAVAILPALAALFFTTATALRTIRLHAIAESQDTVLTMAERFGDKIQSDANALRDLASSGEFAVLLRNMLRASATREDAPADNWKAVAEPLFAPLGKEPISVYSRQGFLGTVTTDGFKPAGDAGAIAGVVAMLGKARLEDSVVFELKGEARPQLWSVSRLAQKVGIPGDQFWLVREVGTARMLEEVERLGLIDGFSPIVLSQNFGPLTLRKEESWVARLREQHADLFKLPAGPLSVADRIPMTVAFARVGALQQLSRSTEAPAAWAILKPIDIDSPTNALFTGVWTILMFGVGLIVATSFLASRISRRLVEPIYRLRAGFHRLEAGDLDFRVTMNTGDEIQELAESMNQMAATLQKTYKSLAEKLLQLDDKAKQLALTHEISKAINRSLDLEQLLKDIITEIRQLVPTEFLAVGLIHDGSPTVDLAYTWPASGAFLSKGAQFPLAESRTRECMELGTVGVYPLSRTGSTSEDGAFRHTGAATMCVVPLRTKTGPVGVLLLADSFEGAFNRVEIDVLKSISESLATAVEHSRLYQAQSKFAEELERQVLERTEALRRAQDQLVQAEKFAATGELAAKLAHEINNPLSIIKNYVKLVHGQLLRPRNSTEDSEMTRDGLNIIGEEIDRIARIVDQLRKLNSPVSPEFAHFDLNRDVQQVIQLFQNTFQQKALSIELDMDPELKDVFLCRDHLRQILINLLRNAFDAVPAQGQIVVRSRANQPAAGFFTLSVRDNGVGISPENMARIFDPFFTTKKDKGTGLGLSVSFGLARNLGGRIEARTPGDGKGAEFRVILPVSVAHKDGAPAAKSQMESQVIKRRGGKIIIG